MEMKELHHVGMVVEDIDLAMAELGATLDTGWAPLQEVEATLWTPEAIISPTLRFTISTSGAPHVELIESVSGTPWSGAARLHHLAFFAEDLVGVSQDLAAGGMPIVVTYHSEEVRPFGFAYHQHPAGTFLELIDGARRPEFAEWIAAADLDAD
jgi:hypothetical protein